MGSIPAVNGTNGVEVEEADVVIIGGKYHPWYLYLRDVAWLQAPIANQHLGGPTGLFVGLLLHRLGVSVSVLGTCHWRPKFEGREMDMKCP